MPQVFLSLGSNVEREKNLRSAVLSLQQIFGELTLSSVYQSAANNAESNDYYNCCARLKTDKTLEEIRAILRNLETELGRDRITRSKVAIDIDLLLYDEVVVDQSSAQLPHPDILQKAYVFRPLCEIAPTLNYPGLKKTLQELEMYLSFNQDLHKLDFSW